MNETYPFLGILYIDIKPLFCEIIYKMFNTVSEIITLFGSLIGIITGIIGCYFGFHQVRGTNPFSSGSSKAVDTVGKKSNLWLILFGIAIVSLAAAATMYVLGLDRPYINTEKKSIAEETLRKYYHSLEDGSFDANNYFADKVETYISMTNTTPSAINDNLRKYYFTDWTERYVSFVVDSITNRSEGYRVQALEDGTYYRKSLKRKQRIRARALIDFDKRDKIVQFQYTKAGLIIE